MEKEQEQRTQVHILLQNEKSEKSYKQYQVSFLVLSLICTH